MRKFTTFGLVAISALGLTAGVAAAANPAPRAESILLVRESQPADDHGVDAATPGSSFVVSPSASPDDKGGATQTAEPGDDKGGASAEPGDDKGQQSAEPGDDNGGASAEPGDDNGGATPKPAATAKPTASPDDKGGKTPKPAATAKPTASPDDSKGGSGKGHHGGSDG